ncbi:MAG TPA: DUF488 family protein [Balneolaceae bacterium]|nr:DUF488 family protein [Balneolaceae bacterium]
MSINLKRIYDDPAKEDGARYLVDRLWPRGVSKEDAQLDGWFKKVTPSDDLRKWFGHDPEKWDEFQTAYKEELSKKEEELNNVISTIEGKDPVTFLFGAKDTDHTHAIVLKEIVEQKM